MSIGCWQPLWLDAQARCLYAAIHPAVRPSGLPGVLFVPPLLHEQPRSRRFMTEVASGLAALGLPCLRFDFFGTGDSAGRGDQFDIGSMHHDLDIAVAALRSHGEVDRVVLLGWRAAALPLHSWLGDGGHADLLVLWEPIADGARWLAELEKEDATERRQRPRPRPGVPRITDFNDGQLMGFAASAQFRRQLAQVRLHEEPNAKRIPTWVVQRAEARQLPTAVARTFALPPNIPTFSGGTDMEATFFLSPLLERVVDELGHAMVDEMGHTMREHELR